MDPGRPPNMQTPAYPPPYSGAPRQPSPAPASGTGSNLPYPPVNPPGYWAGPGAQNPAPTPTQPPPVSNASQNVSCAAETNHLYGLIFGSDLWSATVIFV